MSNGPNKIKLFVSNTTNKYTSFFQRNKKLAYDFYMSLNKKYPRKSSYQIINKKLIFNTNN
jgi:hypothetical protein